MLYKNSLPDRCARLWFNPVITWDGKVIPCCFDKNAEYVMGDLNRIHSGIYGMDQNTGFSERAFFRAAI